MTGELVSSKSEGTQTLHVKNTWYRGEAVQEL